MQAQQSHRGGCSRFRPGGILRPVRGRLGWRRLFRGCAGLIRRGLRPVGSFLRRRSCLRLGGGGLRLAAILRHILIRKRLLLRCAVFRAGWNALPAPVVKYIEFIRRGRQGVLIRAAGRIFISKCGRSVRLCIHCGNTALPEVGGKVGVLRQGHGIRILIDGGIRSFHLPVVERIALRPGGGQNILVRIICACCLCRSLSRL